MTQVRFAPSPTGSLHLGSARTALFNWAFARRHGGRLLLRIEDTDRERSTAESEADLLAGLAWLGIDWDAPPVRQSERRSRHAEAVESMLAAGRAYRCTCSAEQLDERRQATIAAGGKWTYDGRCRDAKHGPDCGPHTVRLRVADDAELTWTDLVFGESGQVGREIGDRIIRRSDGSPLYHLAVVVDDLEMEITHVIRGQDHYNNTPLQLAIYAALDATPPAFAHLPLLVGTGGKKLSKREGSASVNQFREEGFLPEALRNWLIRLGWSHGDQEIFSSEEITRVFDLDAVHRANAQVDRAKLMHLNHHWIRSIPRASLLEAAAPFLKAEAGEPVAVTPSLEQLVDLLRERSRTIAELAERARFFLADTVELEEKAARKHLTEAALPLLAELRALLEALSDWSEKAIEAAFQEVLSTHPDLGMGRLAQPVRVAVTGSSASPGIFETLVVLGRERTLARINAVLTS